MNAGYCLPSKPAAVAGLGSETHALARRACITGSMKQRRDHRLVLQARRGWRLPDPLRG